MADVDTSSYPKPVAQPGLLDTVGKFQALQQGQQNIQIGQQNIQSNAIGIDAAKLKLVNEQFHLMNDEMSTMLREVKDGKINKTEVLNRMNNLGKTFNFPAPVMDHMNNEFANANTKDQLEYRLRASILRGATTVEKLNQQAGSAADVDTNTAIQPGVRSQLYGGNAPQPTGAPIYKGVVPGTQTIDTRQTLPDGSPNPNYRSQIIAPPSAPIIPEGTVPVQGGFSGQAVPQNAAPSMVPQQPVNRLPVSPGAGLPPPDASAAPPLNPNKLQGRVQNPPMVTGLSPGVAEAQKGEVGESVRQSNDLASAANEAPVAKSLIGNLRNDLKYFTPGPGADYKRLAKSFALSNLPIPDSWKKEGGYLDPKSVASQEQFNKVAYNIMQSQFRALGGTGTNSQLENVSHTSPNELMSKMGIEGVVAMLEGNQDAIRIKSNEWQKWRVNNGVESWPKFNADFNSKFDPRVFQFKYMSPKERKDYIANIDNDQDKAKLVNDIHTAISNKWVDRSILTVNPIKK